MPVAQRKDQVLRTVRVLFVDDEPATLQSARQSLSGQEHIEVLVASSIQEAHDVLVGQEVDLLVTDLCLPDGSGLGLVRDLPRFQPKAAAVLMSSIGGTDAPIGALRDGAIDFVSKPFSQAELAERVRAALVRQQSHAFREIRLRKLKVAVRKLNQARKTVSKKVDLLCNDLVGAYTELSRQMDGVRLQESYKQFISGSKGLEQLLCHSMDWLLRQVGYCNIGIWLATADQELQLGAYMKYTVAADDTLVEALQKNLLRMTVRRGFLRLREPETKARLTPVEAKHLSTQDVISTSCTYLGETLGVLLLFRDSQTPFSDEDMASLRVFCPLFALALAQAVRGSKPGGEAAAESTDDGGAATEEDSQESERKGDPSEWWKRGETPPF